MFTIPLLEEDSEIKIIKNSYFEVSSNLNPPFIKFHRVQQNIVHVYISTPLQILCRVKMGRKNFIFHFSSRFFARTTIPPSPLFAGHVEIALYADELAWINQ